MRDRPITSDGRAEQAMRIASYASVVVAFILIFAKTYAWLATGSVAILSSLIDSFLDALASIVTFVAVRHSLQPADREHRFGHGKVEALAALAQSAFIVGSAVLLLFEAGARALAPRPITESETGISIMLFSIGLTLGLVILQKWAIQRSQSVAISADSLHYKGDLLMNGVVIAAIIIVSETGWTLADPLFGAAIAIYIIWSAYLIVRSSFDMLMDRELPDEEREKIRNIALAHNCVDAVHDLRTRQSGLTYFIQLHLEMDGDIKLLQAHEIADEVELSLMKAYPGAEIIIHQDPAGVEEPPQFN
ncbi:MAG: cation diffusion facilitator family transporter [Pseudomonadota bacterium]|nr:cation diffusion facilitator family transporter [Pseudomonadota bacterium]